MGFPIAALIAGAGEFFSSMGVGAAAASTAAAPAAAAASTAAPAAGAMIGGGAPALSTAGRTAASIFPKMMGPSALPPTPPALPMRPPALPGMPTPPALPMRPPALPGMPTPPARPPALPAMPPPLPGAAPAAPAAAATGEAGAPSTSAAQKQTPWQSAVQMAAKFNEMHGKLQSTWGKIGNLAANAIGKTPPPDFTGSEQERYDRLQKNNALMSETDVAKQTGTAKPSIAQMVTSSEAKAWQEWLDKTAKENEQLATGFSNLTRDLMQLGTPLVFLGGGAMFAARMLHRFGAGTLESQRKFSEFSSKIAMTFAKQEAHETVLAVRTAADTEGTTEKLGEALEKLNTDMQPLMAAGINALNIVATNALYLADTLVQALQYTLPIVPLIQKLVNKWVGDDAERDAKKSLMEDVKTFRMKHEINGPYNKRPGEV